MQREVPVFPLGGETIVFDRAGNRQVMRIQGVVVLPIGAEVELPNRDMNATVVGVRLLVGTPTHPVQVCLDVQLPTP